MSVVLTVKAHVVATAGDMALLLAQEAFAPQGAARGLMRIPADVTPKRLALTKLCKEHRQHSQSKGYGGLQ